MTAPLLLLCILAAIAGQVAIGIGVAVWRLRKSTPSFERIRGDEPPPSVTAAWPGWRQFRVERRVFEDSGKTQCSFYLKPVDTVALPPFEPGQFLTVRVNVGGFVVRCYSLSDQPTGDSYRLTVKRVLAPIDRPDLPAGVASSYLHDHLQVGDTIELKAPAGQFILTPDALVPAVLIAGGVGITPMLSMLRWSLENQPDRSLHLYYGVRNGQEHAFKDLLNALSVSHPRFHVTAVYSDPGVDDLLGRDFEHSGYIDLDLLKRTLPAGRLEYFVCGPPPMMASLLPGLRAWGVDPADLHFEAFGPASMQSALGASSNLAPLVSDPIEVTFRRSGRTLSWDGTDTSLLDFAERHGIAVESGCRSGSCGSCETGVASGAVRYAHAPDYEIPVGRCLLCVGTPDSRLVLEA